ncbi:MAG: type VI secretion system-associated FHA domain protein TagH [Pseudomonadota bacterium]
MGVTVSFQPTGPVPGNAAPVTMRGPSLTIGRGPANDLVLPDPDRMLSKSHCVLENQGGNVVVIDLSTNGTFLNYGKTALGPVPTPLSNGDVLGLGMFELLISITDDQPSALDLPPDPQGFAQISPGQADLAPDPLDLLDAPGPEGDALEALLGGNTAPTGPSQLSPVDPIDELLPPGGMDEDDPFFSRPADGRDGQGASLSAHNPAESDVFDPPKPSQQVIPDDWDDLLAPTPAAGREAIAQNADTNAAQDAAPDPLGHDPLGNDPWESQPPQARDPLIPDPPLPDPLAQDPLAQDPLAQDPLAQDPLAPDPVAADPVHTQPTPGRQPADPVPTAVTSEQVQPALAAPPAQMGAQGGAVPAGPAASPSDAAATVAFFKALGAEDLAVRDADLPDTMARAGTVMRRLITGLREILMTRSSIKSEFRIEQTMIAAGGNNPLKFSVSPEQAIESLMRPRGRGYMGAEDAAREALDDIAAHEVAMVAGMESAIKSVLARLSPEVLEQKIERSGRLGSFLRGGRKAQYWDVYEKIFAEISDQAENDFHQFFSREFAKAYQDQLNRLKARADQDQSPGA